MKRLFLAAIISVLSAAKAIGQSVDRIDPPYWWVGMEEQTVELMLYGKDLKGTECSVKYDKCQVVNVISEDNSDYLFVTLKISPKCKSGIIPLKISGKDGSQVVEYELKERVHREQVGFSQKDVIYLLMPDRFVDGDESNNALPGMECVDRTAPNTRHGGDIKGLISSLDYIKELGITTIWPTPLWEMNTPSTSYHGYAATDYYRIDPRYGAFEDYLKLSDECHRRGLKLIIDLVPNHCSIEHPWLSNLPTATWVHPSFGHRELTISAWTDPHASSRDYTRNKDGWFTAKMPDLNQSDPHVLKYLIQNAIWWVEAFGLDGIRVDTFPYCEKEMAAKFIGAIRREYPWMNIVGECWQSSVASVAYWQERSDNHDAYNSCLPSVMDFPLMEAMAEAFSLKNKRGLNKIYNVLSQDYLYSNTENIMVFLDNHDTERFLSRINGDTQGLKAAIGLLLTTRGIPQIYYGTELLLDSSKEGIYTDNANRKHIPGSWSEDERNAFAPEERTADEKDVWEYTSALLNWRKTSAPVCEGELIHFKPKDESYVFFRHSGPQCVMVCLNISSNTVKLDSERYSEFLDSYSGGKNVVTGEKVDLWNLMLEPMTTTIAEFNLTVQQHHQV